MLVYPLTENAELRALEPWRADEFADYIARDREHLAPWLPWAQALTDVDSTRAWLQRYADSTAQDMGRIYGIWLDGRLVGGTLFRVFDVRASTAEIGVWLSAEAGGRGLITLAARRMIDWVFRERKLHRVEWRCTPTNQRSQAVAKRLGMTLDGVLRGAFPHNGVHHDVQVWSLLASEWQDLEDR
ncbi:GNAT family N-acetyltransferase [Allorhizocola rhizosphaerae]|uniref:GNAT family N-acetyltransferase n=1 Tax=Allorhizocola rhizosphaerae TaxID=1872709 RepID=UPI000E3CAB31|nr:GNAT family protein [Allorhizocola rhizosphaerae]